MTNPVLPETDHHIVVSADAHCGAGVRDYKQYLEAKYHADFDAWADDIEAGVARQKAMYKDMERSPLEVGVDGDPDEFGDRNWSSERRLREQEQDGVVATVLFPNTQPPPANII